MRSVRLARRARGDFQHLLSSEKFAKIEFRQLMER
jgi:hypothetical protein